MQPILWEFQSIIRIKGRRTCTAPSKFAIDDRMNVVFKDVISMFLASIDFIPYKFNITPSPLSVHRSKDPDILVFEFHNSFFEVDNLHAIISPSNPQQRRVGTTIFYYFYHIKFIMLFLSLNVNNQVWNTTNRLNLWLICDSQLYRWPSQCWLSHQLSGFLGQNIYV